MKALPTAPTFPLLCPFSLHLSKLQLPQMSRCCFLLSALQKPPRQKDGRRLANFQEKGKEETKNQTESSISINDPVTHRGLKAIPLHAWVSLKNDELHQKARYQQVAGVEGGSQAPPEDPTIVLTPPHNQLGVVNRNTLALRASPI